MSGNIKFRWFLIAPLLVALFVVVTSPVVSLAGELISQKSVYAAMDLGLIYHSQGKYDEAIASYKEAIRIRPDYTNAYYGLGMTYKSLGQYQDAIASYKEAIRIKPRSCYCRQLLFRNNDQRHYV